MGEMPLNCSYGFAFGNGIAFDDDTDGNSAVPGAAPWGPFSAPGTPG